MKIKAVIIAFLLVGTIAATISPVFAAPGIPPNTPAEEPPAERPLPDVYDLAPSQAYQGLDIADSDVPDGVPP